MKKIGVIDGQGGGIGSALTDLAGVPMFRRLASVFARYAERHLRLLDQMAGFVGERCHATRTAAHDLAGNLHQVGDDGDITGELPPVAEAPEATLDPRSSNSPPLFAAPLWTLPNSNRSSATTSAASSRGHPTPA